MSDSRYVHLEGCNVIRITDFAALIEFDGAGYWIPKSQMAEGEAEKLDEGDEGITITITRFIADDRGIDV